LIPGKKYTPEDILAMAWRRKWLIVVPFVLVSVGTYLWSRTLPDQYRSETLILVVPQRVPESYVRPTVTARIEDRLNSIRQQILSRTRLEAIITDLDLYPRLRRVALMEDVIERMRRDITITVARDDSFRVAYTSDKPVTAMRVAERLSRLFIDENLRDREVLAQGTNQFINTQLDDARRRLMEHEKRLEDYRRRHAGELPSQLESNLTVINNTQLQVQALVESINRDRDRLALVERSIADVTTPDANPELSTGLAGPDGSLPAGTTGQQLEAARQALQQMQLRLKPEHPDIQRIQRLLRDLEKKAETEAMEAPLSPGAPGVKPRSPIEIARANRLRELRQETEGLKKQIAAAQSEEQRLRGLMHAYQGRADATPTRESELVELTRDYDTLQKMYTGLLSKSEESKMALNLESRQIGEQFRTLDPPRVPERPFAPDRERLNAIGALGGLALGLAFAAFLEYRDTTLKTDDDVAVALVMPVLAVVPLMMTDADRRRKRRLHFALGTTVFLLTIAGAAAAWFLVIKA
jgi:polysaccharide chain length determinant protein (PEP-CTERM system associated)